MTDQIPADLADKVRKLAARFRQQMEPHTPAAECAVWECAAEAVEALLPAPPRPTLADMTPEERAACRWMQADVENRSVRYAIANPHDAEGDATLVDPYGEIEWFSPERVTPRPDLARLEWPAGDQEPEPAPAPEPALPDGWRLADHKKHGRVIVTNTTPNKDGRVYVIIPAADLMGYDWHFCTPAELTYIDQGDDTPTPPNTLAVGSVWDDVDALTRACEETGRDQITVTDKDGDVSVWGADAGWWETGSPDYGFEPYTIIHAGKKANQ